MGQKIAWKWKRGVPKCERESWKDAKDILHLLHKFALGWSCVRQKGLYSVFSSYNLLLPGSRSWAKNGTAQRQLQYYKLKNKNLCWLAWLYTFQIQKKELETNLRRQYVKWLKAQIAERGCMDGFKHWLHDLKQDSKLPYPSISSPMKWVQLTVLRVVVRIKWVNDIKCLE